jgi:5-methylcytosine-specific restriction enzyme A
MPSRAKRLCPRCGELYVAHCTTCQQRWQQRSQLRRANQPDPYTTSQWIKFSRAFLKAHPYCECEDCITLPIWKRPRSQVTDHRDGLGPLGPRGYDPSNCCAMTIAHHGRKTAKHDGGYGRDRSR